jgi:dynactin complex subunit
MQTSLQLNSRINHNGYKGTIRYIGGVEGTTGSWLGVEWDDRTRGKHSGVKDGKSYFQCRFVLKLPVDAVNT